MTKIEIQILNHIKNSENQLHVEINNDYLCKKINISEEQMITALENLVGQGVLKKDNMGYVGSLLKNDATVTVYKLV